MEESRQRNIPECYFIKLQNLTPQIFRIGKPGTESLDYININHPNYLSAILISILKFNINVNINQYQYHYNTTYLHFQVLYFYDNNYCLKL